MSARKISKVGLLATVAGAAAAGYYFYSSPDAKEHRRVAAKWAQDFKRDVMKHARNAKNIDRKTLESIVTNTAKTYHGLKNLDRAQVSRAAGELKANWQQVMKELGKDVSSAKKTVKTQAGKAHKTVKKAVKKVSKAARA